MDSSSIDEEINELLHNRVIGELPAPSASTPNGTMFTDTNKRQSVTLEHAHAKESVASDTPTKRVAHKHDDDLLELIPVALGQGDSEDFNTVSFRSFKQPSHASNHSEESSLLRELGG